MSQIQVPKGWEISNIKNEVEIISLQNKKIKQKDYKPNGKIPIIDQGKSLIGGYVNDLNFKLECNLPVIIFGDHTRAIKFIDFEFAAGADGIKVLKPSKKFHPKLFYYFLQAIPVSNRGYARHFSMLKEKEILIPPLETQEKIVQKLDYILGQLEEKEKIIQNLRNNNKQLLEKLIQNKRGQRPSGFLSHTSFKIFSELMLLCENNTSDYRFETIEQCCAEIIDTPHSTVKYEISGVPVIRTSDVYPEVIDFNNTKFTNEETYQVRKRKIDPKIGDVLYTREAPWGIAAVVKEPKFVVGQRILLLRPDDSKIYGSFLSLFLNSLLGYQQALKIVNRTTSEHINIADIRKFKIPIIPKREQLAILKSMETKNNELELINNKINAVITYQNSLLGSLHIIKNSILNSAFSGKLVN